MLLSDLIRGAIPTAPNPAGKGINPAEHLHHADAHDADLLEITTETTSTATLPEPDDWPVGYGSLPTIADTDDRRTCGQCLNLRAGVCRVASPGGLVSANSGYRPNASTLLRCIGYTPTKNDTDQRPGRDRWPGL